MRSMSVLSHRHIISAAQCLDQNGVIRTPLVRARIKQERNIAIRKVKCLIFVQTHCSVTIIQM